MTGAWLEGIAPSKIADFAAEATACDADMMGDITTDAKRIALLASLVHAAQARARDRSRLGDRPQGAFVGDIPWVP
jgi:hypothetical protein